jgi:hypothetical protein
MKKLLSIAIGSVIATAALQVSAAIQYKMENFSGGSWFSVDKKQTVYLNVKKTDGSNVALGDSVISNIGWYKYNDIVHSILPGVSEPTLNYGDMKTGALGEFSPEDKIVLWIETTNENGQKQTFSMFNPKDLKHDIWATDKSGENIVLNWGDFVNLAGSQKTNNPEGFEFSISTNAPPSGQPLPGIIATLLVGGGCGSLIYLKKRKKVKAAK